MTTATETFAHPIADLKTQIDLGAFENSLDAPMTLTDLMRQGSTVTEQAIGSFGNGVQACGLSAIYIAAKANEVI